MNKIQDFSRKSLVAGQSYRAKASKELTIDCPKRRRLGLVFWLIGIHFASMMITEIIFQPCYKSHA